MPNSTSCMLGDMCEKDILQTSKKFKAKVVYIVNDK